MRLATAEAAILFEFMHCCRGYCSKRHQQTASRSCSSSNSMNMQGILQHPSAEQVSSGPLCLKFYLPFPNELDCTACYLICAPVLRLTPQKIACFLILVSRKPASKRHAGHKTALCLACCPRTGRSCRIAHLTLASTVRLVIPLCPKSLAKSNLYRNLQSCWFRPRHRSSKKHGMTRKIQGCRACPKSSIEVVLPYQTKDHRIFLAKSRDQLPGGSLKGSIAQSLNSCVSRRFCLHDD